MGDWIKFYQNFMPKEAMATADDGEAVFQTLSIHIFQ